MFTKCLFHYKYAFSFTHIIIWASLMTQMVKNSPAMQETRVLIPELGRSLGEGNGYPTSYFCLENSKDRGDWQATVLGVAKNLT